MSESKVEVLNRNKPLKIDKKLQWNIYQECLRLGCCERCCARFACLIPDYQIGDALGLDVKQIIQENLNCEWELIKNEQEGHCAVCLGALEERIIEEIVQHKGIQLLDAYHSDDFRLQCSIPTCILIRERCMMIHLKEKYGGSFPYLHVRSIRQVLCRSLFHFMKLAGLTSKVPIGSSRITLKVIMHYPFNIQETNQIRKIAGFKHDGMMLGVRRVMDALSSTSNETIKNCMKVPPKRSLLDLILGDVYCHSETIVLRGLFNRYSRLLPQISQTLGKRNIYNYATILKTAIHDVLDDEDLEVKVKGTKFFLDHSRILGSGEVICIEMTKSKYPVLREEQLQAIEEHINENPMVFVKDLHQVDKITEPEKGPIECCKVLCMVFDKDLEQCINCINNCGEVRVTQRQPIRWLAVKKLGSRSTTIYKLFAASIPGKTNLLEVCLWIGASKLSFAIPEFVNGDFGRTKPSLSDIAGAKLDMLAIDHIAEEVFI